MPIKPRSQLIFDKSIYDLCPYKKKLFCHKKFTFILQFTTKIYI